MEQRCHKRLVIRTAPIDPNIPEDAHCDTTFVRCKHICNDSTGVRQRGGSECASEEPKNDECLDILGARSASVKGSEHGIRAKVEQLPAP